MIIIMNIYKLSGSSSNIDFHTLSYLENVIEAP